MLDRQQQLNMRCQLKALALSDEEALNRFRVRKVKLGESLADVFYPALGMARKIASQVFSVEDSLKFVTLTDSSGLSSVRHADGESPRAKLFFFGFQNADRVIRAIR